MDSLSDILNKKNLNEPPEIGAIKKFAQEHFKSNVGIQVKQNSITIITRSAALANALRLKTPQLKEAAKTDKKLIFRIGS